MEYDVSARAYLSRARDALLSDDPRTLFYAALELRCCIETRQEDYASALVALEGQKIKPHKIGDTGQRLRQKSMTNRIAYLRYDFGGGVVVDTYHTPVTDAVVDFGEKFLGRLLHCQRKFRPPSDAWWKETRERVLDGYRLAWVACQGNSLVPPLYDGTTGEVHPQHLEQTPATQPFFDRMPLTGQRFTVQVRYLDAVPTDWVCDL